MLYKLERIGETDWDEYSGFVIRAKDTEEARLLAGNQDPDRFIYSLNKKPGKVWLDPKLSTCKQLDSVGDSEIISGSFKAG